MRKQYCAIYYLILCKLFFCDSEKQLLTYLLRELILVLLGNLILSYLAGSRLEEVDQRPSTVFLVSTSKVTVLKNLYRLYIHGIRQRDGRTVHLNNEISLYR